MKQMSQFQQPNGKFKRGKKKKKPMKNNLRVYQSSAMRGSCFQYTLRCFR